MKKYYAILVLVSAVSGVQAMQLQQTLPENMLSYIKRSIGPDGACYYTHVSPTQITSVKFNPHTMSCSGIQTLSWNCCKSNVMAPHDAAQWWHRLAVGYANLYHYYYVCAALLQK